MAWLTVSTKRKVIFNATEALARRWDIWIHLIDHLDTNARAFCGLEEHAGCMEGEKVRSKLYLT